MRLLIMIFLRAVRVFKCFMHSLPKALSASSLAIVGAFGVMWMLRKGGSLSCPDCFLMTFTIVLLVWTVTSIIDIASYGMNIHHMYDDKLIGSAFSGIGHKSLMFEGALVKFHHEEYQEALDAFTAVSDGRSRLTGREEGVLEYYRGRCYQIMKYYPNAAACYERSLKTEFSAPFTEFFLARCYSSGGDTARAEEIYRSMTESGHKFAALARTEAGRMYLELNDGKSALKWFSEAIERHENYAEALGGAAVAHTILRDTEKGEELFRLALLNHINDPDGFTSYFRSVQAAVVLGSTSRSE